MTNKSLPKDVQFCIITPTAYLQNFAAQSNRHLVLAHLVDTDQQYANFYKKISEDRQQFIIMDNGAFELGGSYDPDKLIALGNKCGADVLVLPDYPLQPAKKTIDAAIERIPQFKAAGFKTMFVPQSEVGDLEGWIESYKWASNNPDIDIIAMSILGIPNALPDIPNQYARVVMTSILKDRGILSKKYHHYLGLNTGPNLEIPALLRLGALNSCDSSNPVWCAINGIRYNITTDSYMPISKKYLRAVDFNTPMKGTHIQEAIQYNINLTMEIFDKYNYEKGLKNA